MIRRLRSLRLTHLAAVPGLFVAIVAIVQGQQFRGWDTDTHLFFASHYLRSWWDTFEPRWYQGFDVASYPPLAHQLLALLSVFGLDTAAQILAVLLLLLFPVAVYRFARLFVDHAEALCAAGWSLLFPAFHFLLISAGQLPGILGLELLLLAFGALPGWVRGRSRWSLATFVAGIAAAAAAHHATPVLLGPLLGLAVLWRYAWCPEHWKAAVGSTGRLLAAAGAAAAAEGIVILPFWLWWLHRPSEVPIDHVSRHSLFTDPAARLVELWAPYSLWLLALPLAMFVALRRPRLIGLAFVSGVLFILSLGGTTALPSLLYGSEWQWLTYERFSLWAGAALLPLAGAGLTWLAAKLPRLLRSLVTVALVTALSASAVYAAWFATIASVEPPALDMAPIVTFLAQPGRQDWRYLTLGFGDQMSRLAAYTSASSVDGNYDTARWNPLLSQSGVDKLDNIRYYDPDFTALARFLETPQDTNLGWVFVNERTYEPLLRRTGWRNVASLSNSVGVWARPTMPSPVQPERQATTFSDIWWGTAPLLALTTFLGLTALSAVRVRHSAAAAVRLRWLGPRRAAPAPAAG
ncbi:MAG: DUF6541 family protein [Chloroflexota bacterium]